MIIYQVFENANEIKKDSISLNIKQKRNIRNNLLQRIFFIMIYYFIVLLMFTNTNGLEERLFQQENDIHGTRLAVNEHISMFADNLSKTFFISKNPFSSSPIEDSKSYDSVGGRTNTLSFSYVHSIVTGIQPNKNNSIFAFIAEINNGSIYLIVMWISLNDLEVKENKQIELRDHHLVEQTVLSIDSKSEHIYVVHLTGTFYFNVNSKMIEKTYHHNGFWDGDYFMIGKALAVTNDRQLYLLAYRQKIDRNYFLCLYTIDHSNLSMPISFETIEWSIPFSSTFLTNNKELSALSIDLNETSNMLILGIPLIDSVLIYFIEDRSKSPILRKNHTSIEKAMSFGKSVSFLDNKTYIVLAYLMSTPWSHSQIQVRSFFKNISEIFSNFIDLFS